MSELSQKIKAMREMAFENMDLTSDKILTEFYMFIERNEDIIKDCYNVDNEIKDKKTDLTIKRMLDTITYVKNYEAVDTKIYSLLNERKIIKYVQNKGVIGVVYNGDLYITIELIAKAIKTGNALILNIGLNNNIGTNNLIVNAVKDILKNNNKPSNLIDINFSENDNIVNEDLDSLIVIGDRETQEKYISCNNDIIKSGYGYCEIYIDDLNNENIIKEIIKNSEFKIDIYINSILQTDIQGHKVNGLLDAIDYINKKGSGFASTIFSDNNNCQKVFLKRCKSKHVFINADPNIAEESNINIENFCYNKVGMV